MSTSCSNVFTVAVPGPAGPAGATGASGTNGNNAYTTVASYAPAAQPVMPAPTAFVGATLTLGSPIIVVGDTSAMVAGMTLDGPGMPSGTTILNIIDATHLTATANATANGGTVLGVTLYVTVNTTSSTAFMAVGETVYLSAWGTLFVISLPSSTSVQLRNPERTVTNEYLSNAPAGTTLPAGTSIVPTGREGVMGATPTGAFLVANNLAEGTPATMRTSLGLGTVATFTQGNADTNVPRVDLGGGLVATRAVFATAAGLETKTGAAAVTAIGAQPSDATLTSIAALGTAADKIAYTTGVDTWAETGLTAYMRTVLPAIDAATARGLLGLGSPSLDYSLYRYETATTVIGANYVVGPWTVVPFNTEVVDEGNHGSVAAGAVTLAAGTYRYQFRAVMSSVGIFQGRLTINGSVATNGYGSSGGDSNIVDNLASVGQGVFTIGAAANIRVEVFGAATGFFGAPSNTGGPEIYSSIEFWRE